MLSLSLISVIAQLYAVRIFLKHSTENLGHFASYINKICEHIRTIVLKCRKKVLSENHSHHMQQKQQSPPHLIGYHDWQHIRKSKQYQGQTMIIVSQPETENKTIEVEVKKKYLLLEAANTSTALPKTNIPSSPIISIPKTIDVNIIGSTLATTSKKTISELFTTSLTPVSTIDPLANITSFLRHTAPILSYIPDLVKILQSSELWNRNRPVASLQQSNLFHDIRAFGVKQELHVPTHRADIRQKQGHTDHAKDSNVLWGNYQITTGAPLQFTSSLDPSFVKLRKNTYEITMTTARPDSIPYVYPLLLPQNEDFTKETTAMNDNRQSQEADIRVLHRELFQRKEEHKINTTCTTKAPIRNKLIVFERPSSSEKEVAKKLTELVKYLALGSSNDLKLLQKIPEIDNLTRGLDLTQVLEPGGTSKLRKQFLERLKRPTNGLPLNNTSIPQSKSTISQRQSRKMSRIRKSNA